MVFSPIPISFDMSKSVNSNNLSVKPRQFNQSYKNRTNQLNIPACDQSRSAIIDVIILIAVISSSGFLFYPYAKILTQKTFEFGQEILSVLIEEIARAPMVFMCLGLSILFALTGLLAIAVCVDRRCGKQGCRGLRKAAEFDIQLETEECVRRSTYLTKTPLMNGLFELPRDHHRELEAELKKMAPINGRAVLVFRARCGCSVGRMEVPGPRKTRKVKK